VQRIARCRHVISLAVTLALVASCDAAPSNGRQYSAKSFDGEDISYTVFGQGDVTLLFVHGWSCDGGYWREQTPVFESQYRVITMDLAGHGNSTRKRKVYSIESFAKDVHAVIEAANAQRVIVIGHSFGGEIAATAASITPDKVIGLVGVDTLHNVEEWYSQEDAAKLIGIEGFKKDFKAQTKVFVGQMMPKDCDAKLLKWIIDDMSASPPEVGVSALQEYTRTIADKAMLDVFKRVKVPVVCVNADQWPMNPEANRRHMKSFDAKIIKGVGHFPMLERPGEFNRLLAEAVKEITGRQQ
jgi:pimeloyl-ACP methyl ester carboxylesterase